MRHCLKNKVKVAECLWSSISTQDMLQGWPPWICPVHFFKGACGVGPDTFLPFPGPGLILFLGPVSSLGNASIEGRMSVNPTTAQPTVKPLGSGTQWPNQESCHCAAPWSPFLIQNRATGFLKPHMYLEAFLPAMSPAPSFSEWAGPSSRAVSGPVPLVCIWEGAGRRCVIGVCPEMKKKIHLYLRMSAVAGRELLCGVRPPHFPILVFSFCRPCFTPQVVEIHGSPTSASQCWRSAGFPPS